MKTVAAAPLALGRDGSATVTFQASDRQWWLWRPCRACGGVELPLRRPLDALDGQPCPGCETRRRRLEPARQDPAVWYDTWLGDWVVQLPCRDSPEGVLMPLEIRSYDAGWADVYRTAADVVYAGEPD